MARWSISWALAVWGLAERGKGVKREPADNVCTTANVVKIRRNIIKVTLGHSRCGLLCLND